MVAIRMEGEGEGGGSVGKERLPMLVPGIEPRLCGHLSAHISQRSHPTVLVYIYIYIYMCVCVCVCVCVSIIYVCALAYGYVYKLNNLLLFFVFTWT